MYGSTGILFMQFAGVPVQKTLKIIGRSFLIFLPAGAIMVSAKILKVNGTVEVFIATLLFVLYWVYLIKTDSKIREILVQHRILQR